MDLADLARLDATAQADLVRDGNVTPAELVEAAIQAVEVLDPQKHETILDPACGTAGFLISAYKHILRSNTSLRPSPLKSLRASLAIALPIVSCTPPPAAALATIVPETAELSVKLPPV